MRNERLVSEEVRKAVKRKKWNCACGQEDLRFSFTRKGKVQAHCFRCGQTIFFNDPQIFLFKSQKYEGPWFFQEEEPIVKEMKGGRTKWYPKSRVRVFKPE